MLFLKGPKAIHLMNSHFLSHIKILVTLKILTMKHYKIFNEVGESEEV